MNKPKPQVKKMTFSGGEESATLVACSNLLRRSLEAISELYEGINSNEQLSFKVKEELNLKVIAFVTTPMCTQHHLQPDLVSSSALMDKSFPHFEFLCNRNNPSFSVNNTAITLFYDHREQLHELKSQIDIFKPLIVTGHALGGSIASLFTLWLLDSMGSGKKRPLCITFGSPLIGDQSLQQAISRNSTWNSCFLHLASHQDPLPTSFISSNLYKPFGTFLLSSDEGSACFEEPESILNSLAAMGSISDPNQVLQIHHYGNIVENLNRKAITSRAECMTHSNSLGESQLQMKRVFDPSKKLNDMKIKMAHLEWYKKYSKTQEIGYYDMYKNQDDRRDQDVVRLKKELTLYWENMVEVAEKKPQKEGAAFLTRWLFAGTNYRRMVEPLDIADYFKGGGKDYETQGRSKHYQQLEEWLKEEKTPSASGALNTTNKQNVGSILTIDSCFWAHVEEALLACRLMKTVESSRQKLIEFEDYVYGLLKNYAVSPEIFLKHSTFMRWWNEYKEVVGSSYNSPLANFMRSPGNYNKYAEGAFNFR